MGIFGGERIFYGRVETLVEITQNSRPFLLSFRYFVELFLDAGGEVIVEDIGEVLH